ncbi:LCP family protein [Bacillus sp. FJAT-50079]|uniref:LCP family glycopolymer transferase n=1 Tax=Bacillus sp. FJAT-50079 TaxID=2833577 RepID=UPI001BCA20C7|nr:LCP family protein [Bacillus sp. FJAT-50079]MBS4206743.1 LCP family protein [Bacillus sp. FJAT-50079]
MEQSRISKRKKRKGLKKLIFFLLIVVVLVPLCYVGYLFTTIKTAADKSYVELERKKSEYRVEDVKLGKDPVSILLVGVEDYLGDNGRADALMLITLNPETKEIALLSIPRDTRTYIEVKNKKDKINHAYAFGGLDSTIQAVEDLLEIPVDYYVETNISGFQDVVNELGGISVDVPFDFKQVGMDGKMIYFTEGKMNLNGREAMAFVQMRKEDPRGDFGRQDRQQEALKAIADKALSINSITKADNLVNAVSDNTKTNIPLTELFGLRNFYSEIKNQEINRLELKGEDSKIDGIYYYQPYEDSINEVSLALKDVLEISNIASDTITGN